HDSIRNPAGNTLGVIGTDHDHLALHSYPTRRSSHLVSSINRAGSNPTKEVSVSWTVTFSESVSGVDTTDFTLASTGLGGTPGITSVTGRPTVYTVGATTGTGNGTLALTLLDDDSTSDAAGN